MRCMFVLTVKRCVEKKMGVSEEGQGEELRSVLMHSIGILNLFSLVGRYLVEF